MKSKNYLNILIILRLKNQRKEPKRFTAKKYLISFTTDKAIKLNNYNMKDFKQKIEF